MSSAPELITMDKLKGEHQGIAVLHMNFPQKKNAISKRFLTELHENLYDLKFDKEVRVVILKSDVQGTFCAGADLKERKEMSAEDVPKFVDHIRTATNKIAGLPQPIIAAIDGFALGGGLELALACDIRVANESAKMGLIETKWALIPGAGGSVRLSRIVGLAKAKELIFTARLIQGKEAASIGLVNHMVPTGSDAAFYKALQIAQEITKNGPVAVRVAKIAIDTGSEIDLASGMVVEQQCYAQIVPTKDRLEGLQAFAEKRPPIYKGE